MINRLFGFLLISILSSSCGFFKSKDELLLVAKYQDDVLTEKAVSLAIPENLSPDDSLIFLKHFVNSWAREKAILEHAVFNLKDDELEIETLVSNYRKSLIKQRFEQNYLAQKLDTVVKEPQLNEYYNRNKSILILKESIIKINYIRLPKLAPDIEDVKLHMNFE